MEFEIDNLSDAQLAALHERTSKAVREKKPMQMEDIKPGMSAADIERARKAINAALKGQ